MHTSCLQSIVQYKYSAVRKHTIYIEYESGDSFECRENVHMIHIVILSVSEGLFLIIPPLIYPGTLDHFQVSFCALFAGANKSGYLQYPFQQVGETNPVNL